MIALAVALGELPSLHLPVIGAEQAPLAPEIESEARTLLAQLDHPKRERREQAEQRLIELGSSVSRIFPHEREVNAQVRLALYRIKQAWQRRTQEQRWQGGQLSPSQSLTLAESSRLLGASLGIQVDRSSGLPQESVFPTKLTTRPVSWWSMVDDLAHQQNARWSWNNATQTLLFSPRKPQEMPPVAVGGAGPLRVSLETLRWSESPQESRTQTGQLELQFHCEPGLFPLVLECPLDSLVLQSNGGSTFRAAVPNSRLEASFVEGELGVTLRTQIAGAAPPTQDLYTLTGKCSILAVTSYAEFRFPPQDRLPRARLTQDQLVLELLPIHEQKTAPKSAEVRIRVRFSYTNAGPEFESYRAGLPFRSAWWELPSGQRIPVSGIELVELGNGAATLDYRFEKLPAESDSGTLLLKVMTGTQSQTFDWQVPHVSLKNPPP